MMDFLRLIAHSWWANFKFFKNTIGALVFVVAGMALIVGPVILLADLFHGSVIGFALSVLWVIFAGYTVWNVIYAYNEYRIKKDFE
jgi:hypothetical protein